MITIRKSNHFILLVYGLKNIYDQTQICLSKNKNNYYSSTLDEIYFRNLFSEWLYSQYKISYSLFLMKIDFEIKFWIQHLNIQSFLLPS
jgi:hypothetical protein